MNVDKDWLVYEDAELRIESPHQFSNDPTQANIDFWVRYKAKSYAGNACTLANIAYLMPKCSKEDGFDEVVYYGIPSDTIILQEMTPECLTKAVKQMIINGDIHWKLLPSKPEIQVEQLLKEILGCYAAFLDTVPVAQVQCHIDMAEYKNAFELLVISLKLAKVPLSGRHAGLLISEGLLLDMDKSQVYAADFWQQHESWLEAFRLLNRQQARHSAAYFDPALKPSIRLQESDDGAHDSA